MCLHASNLLNRIVFLYSTCELYVVAVPIKNLGSPNSVNYVRHEDKKTTEEHKSKLGDRLKEKSGLSVVSDPSEGIKRSQTRDFVVEENQVSCEGN